MSDKAYDRLPTIRSRELRNRPTDAEKRLWAILRNRQIHGCRFNRQVPIGPYICDFVARSERVIVEVDGGQHSESSDADRTRILLRQGYRLIRFWNNDVLGNIEGVVTELEQFLEDRPSPNPSRKREGNAPLPLAGGEEARSAEGEGLSGTSNIPSPSPSRKAGGEQEG